MNQLLETDLQTVLEKLPISLKKLMEKPEWHNRIFVAGGVIRDTILGDEVNDIDIFATNRHDVPRIIEALEVDRKPGILRELEVVKTANATTIKTKPLALQVIGRWVFSSPAKCAINFDFAVCGAVIYYGALTEIDGPAHGWQSFCLDRFYPDMAARRLFYQGEPNMDPAGSVVRLLKFVRRGYQVDPESLAELIIHAADQDTDLEDGLSGVFLRRIKCGLNHY